MSSSNPIDSSQQMESQPIPMDPEEVPEAKPVRKVPSYKLFAELNGHRKPISVVRFSPNGQLLASGSVDKYFRIWRTEGEIEEKAVVKAHVAGLNDIGWTYDSCFLATCSDDQTAKIFDVSTHKRKLTLKGHKDYIISVAFNAYGNMVLTGSYDNTARLWDVRDGRCIRELQGHKEPLSAASFNHDGTLICTSSHDGFVNLWDTTSGKCAKTVLDMMRCKGFIFIGAQLRSGRVCLVLNVSGYLHSFPTVCGLRTSQNEPHFDLQGNHDDTAGISCGFSKFSPNGRYIMASKQDSNIYLIDIKKDKIVKRYTGHKNEQFCLFADFSVTSGSYIVCGSEDGKIYIWDLQQGEIVQVVDNPSPLVIGSVNCHPSKNVIVSSAIGVEDQVVRIWHSEA